MHIGMVGLGLLGSALATRFLQAGLSVTGWDLDSRRRTELSECGGSSAMTIRDVLTDTQRVVFSLPTTGVVESVLTELAPLPPGLTIVDTTTGDPERTVVLGTQLQEQGIQYLDATVLGSSEQARAGDVVVMVGGDAEAVASCVDLFNCFAKEWFHLGPCGAGSRMKLVVNLVLGLHRAVLGEGLAFARANGIAPAQALKVLQSGAAYSRVMDTKGQKMIEENFSPQARLAQHLKDVHLILAQAKRVGVNLPLSMLHRTLLEQLEAAGLGDQDNSAIIKVFG